MPPRSVNQRWAATVLVVALLGTSTPLAALAGPVSTEQALGIGPGRDQLISLLQREDIAAALAAQGVSADLARLRVAALNDDEVARLAQRMNQLPAGGDFLGVAAVVFVALLLTDVLGFTKVFPFTRSIR